MKVFDRGERWLLVFLLVFAAIYAVMQFGARDMVTGIHGAATSGGQDVEMTAARRDVEISFSFRHDERKLQYEDVFQTADGNQGMRMESSDASTTGVWGFVFPGADGGLQSVPFPMAPTPHVWHDMRIEVKGDDFRYYLDGTLQKREKLAHPDFLLNRIRAGIGFSDERPFSGQVRDFQVRISHHVPGMMPVFFLMTQTAAVLLFLLGKKWGIISFGFFRQGNWRTRSWFFLSFFASMLVIFRCIHKTLPPEWWRQVPYFEAAIALFFIFWWLWKRCALSHYAECALFSTLVVFLKSRFLAYSFSGIFSDYCLCFLLLAMFQGVLQRCRFSRLLAGGVAVAGALMTGFLTMGAVYIRQVQRISQPNTLFGEEFQAVLQTNVHEAGEFLLSVFNGAQLGWIFLGASIGGGLLYASIAVVKQAHPRRYFRIFITALLVMAVGSSYAAGVGQSLLSPMIQLADGYRQSIASIQRFQAMRRQNASLLEASKTGKGETYVLVIGEAGNRRHYSAYGYFRDTSPWMKSLRDDANAIFLENAYASFCHTVPSLLNALTSANQYNQQVSFEAPSIIEAAKAAGFNTYWFSNQNRYGLIDNPLTVLAEESDEVYFTPNSNMGTDDKIEDLLKEHLQDIDPDANNLIVIHLLGSHAKYTSRLPKGYPTDWTESGQAYLGDVGKDEKFVREVLNPYDATIRFTDENLETMYHTIKELVPDLSAYVYVPDHGEDVYGRKFHDSTQFTWDMVHVPFVMLFSDEWMQKNEGRFSLLQQNRERPLTTDLLYNYMLGIMGVQSNTQEEQYDIGADGYDITWDNGMTMWTDKHLQTQFYGKANAVKLNEDPLYQKRAHISWLNQKDVSTGGGRPKYLAVECDAVAAAYEALTEGFRGMEINITPVEGKLMIGHWPEYVSDMSLEEWLRSVPQENIEKLWLDMKLADSDAIDEALADLERLDEDFHLKGRVLVESSMVNPRIANFADHGWDVMYYFLPTRDRASEDGVCPPAIYRLVENKSGEEREYAPTQEELPQIRAYAEAVAEHVQRQQVKSISFWAECYPFLKEEVVPRLGTSIGLATFAIPGMPRLSDLDFVQRFQTSRHQALFTDGAVHTILLDPETPFGIRLD